MENMGMSIDLSFFKNKKIFITGHTGFKGSWLAFWLTELGAEVSGYALPPTVDGSLFEKLNLANRLHHTVGDIRDTHLLSLTMAKAKPEFVFHLAAQALVRKSYQEPQETFSTNILGSVNLLEAVRCCESVRSLVYITSDKCYLNKEWVWGYRENDELGGADPYSASKACAEHIFRSYYLSYFKYRENFGCGATRAGNVIGGGDCSLDRIVPDVIQAVVNRAPIILRSPMATRPWQHVLDPLYGYLTLAIALYQQPKLINGESWNFGPEPDSIISVNALVEKLVAEWGSNITIQHEINALHEATLLYLAIDKAKLLLNWQPKYAIDMAVNKTSAWYKSSYQQMDVIEITRQQITEFVQYG